MKITKHDNVIEVIFDKLVSKEKDQFTQDQQFSILLDLSKPKLFVSASSLKTVAIYQDILKLKQTSKMAVLGKRNFAEKIVKVIFQSVSDKKANWFIYKQEALLWLST